MTWAAVDGRGGAVATQWASHAQVFYVERSRIVDMKNWNRPAAPMAMSRNLNASKPMGYTTRGVSGGEPGEVVDAARVLRGTVFRHAFSASLLSLQPE